MYSLVRPIKSLFWSEVVVLLAMRHANHAYVHFMEFGYSLQFLIVHVSISYMYNVYMPLRQEIRLKFPTPQTHTRKMDK
jgi:hypothetical protein